MTNECEHPIILWDDAPDYHGCHGISMKWFGECEDCGARVYELWSRNIKFQGCAKSVLTRYSRKMRTEMRRKAFWGEQGLTKRPISGVNNGELLDMEISMFGIRFYDRAKSQALRWLPWAELHRLAQQGPLEQLGAAVAERSEPRTVQIHGRDCDIGDCVCGLNEPRILPVEE